MWVRIGSALAFLLALAGGAWADEGESRAIAKGRWSLAFSLPDGGGAQFGVWKMVSGRSNLGLNLGIDHQFQEETWGPDSARSRSGTLFWTFSLQPAIKRYLFLRERVSPFVTAALEGSYGWVSAGGLKEYDRKATLLAGLGADWTPLRDVSIGASTGIKWIEGIRAENDATATKHRISVFDTQTGSLTLHLYF
jgi:hypothetical protein